MLLLFQIFRSKFILKSLIAIGLVIKEKSNLLIHKNLRMLLIFIYLKYNNALLSFSHFIKIINNYIVIFTSHFFTDF